MNYTRYRKHPRVYSKKNDVTEERSLTLSATAAVGILAFVFVKGMFWGYIIKKSTS